MKTPMTFRLLPDIADYLRSTDNQAVEIEAALRRSRGYQEWKEAMEAKASGKVNLNKKTKRVSRTVDQRPARKGRGRFG